MNRISHKYALREVFLRPEGFLMVIAFTVMPLISGFLLYKESKSDIQAELYQLCNVINENLDPAKYELLASSAVLDKKLQMELLSSLSLIHLSNPKIRYIYTVTEIENEWYFILDTLQNPAVFDKLKNHYTRDNISNFREKYDYPPGFLQEIEEIQRGEMHLDEGVYLDEYGKTIGCLIGIRDGEKLVGALGVDYSVEQFDDIEINIIRGITAGCIIGIIFLLIAIRYLYRHMQERQQLLHELDQLSHIDSLTEISNRRAFFLSCENLAKNAKKESYKAAAIIDIDWFKKVNDEYGHRTGDQTLKHFAKLLNHCCNINKFIIGRVGGEEFAVFCATTEVDDMVEALASLKKLLSKSSVVMDELEFKITFSAGYIVSHDDKVDVHDLLAYADKALYDAKKTGRDRIVEFLGQN